MSPRHLPAEIPVVHRTETGAFRPGWRWPKDIRRWMAQQLSDLHDPPPQPVAHIPCGSSRLGGIRVDKHHPGANVRADMFHLPFADGALGTVVSDPPWNLNFHERFLLHGELARVLRPGGRLLWQAPWLPSEGLFEIDRIDVHNFRVGLARNVRILVRATRRRPGPKVGRGQTKHPRTP